MNRGLKSIYGRIHGRYELINHILTFGLDIRWRKRAAVIAAESGGRRWIDLCCGTGEMALQLKVLSPRGGTVLAADFSKPMIREAQAKHASAGIHFVLSDVGALPFSDESFDLVTVSFAARNLDTGGAELVGSFREVRRVLRAGGRFINLETSRPENRFVRWIFHTYVRLVVRPIGRMISGSEAGYAYLSSSILRFYSMSEMSDILHEAGFTDVSVKPLLRGIAAVHEAVRGDIPPVKDCPSGGIDL
jgi:demethylmenaquinone methyltransferase/2-methoxy-6-polyprenyl-1,4-benzoquinol methylase